MSAVPYGMMEEFGAFEPAVIGILIALLVFYLAVLIFAIVSYVLRSLGVYTIAKRRGIHHPWLAWLPVGDAWIVGSIFDQYQYVAKGKVRNRRKVLLGLNIAILALGVPVIIAEVVAIVTMESAVAAGVAGIVVFMGVYLAYLALAIVTTVFTYMAQYDLYYSCNPDNAVMFLVLGIFFGVLQPFFIFVCRKKDLGMPPRKQTQTQPVVAELPQEISAEEPVASAEPQADAEVAEETTPEEVAEEPVQILEDSCLADEADFAPETPSEDE